MEITLKKPEVEVLRVNIGDKAIEIPLGPYLTVEDYASLSTFEGTVAFYNRFIPAKIAKNLTFAEYNQITEAWTEATKKAGIKSGE